MSLYYKAMLIKESVLRPEIFQILSTSQAKTKHKRKNIEVWQNSLRLNSYTYMYLS